MKLEIIICNALQFLCFYSAPGNIFQEIPGENTIRIRSLAAEKLNGIPAKSLLTINTDQNITGHVYFPAKMLLKSVVTKKINGIDIADFAMVSKKNYFRGMSLNELNTFFILFIEFSIILDRFLILFIFNLSINRNPNFTKISHEDKI